MTIVLIAIALTTLTGLGWYAYQIAYPRILDALQAKGTPGARKVLMLLGEDID